MKGIVADIYRPSHGDCSAGGISAIHGRVLVVGKGVPEITEDDDTLPVVTVEIKMMGNDKFVHARPIEKPNRNYIGWMMGGCFIWSSDSRFREIINEYPVPLHNRQELIPKDE